MHDEHPKQPVRGAKGATDPGPRNVLLVGDGRAR